MTFADIENKGALGPCWAEISRRHGVHLLPVVIDLVEALRAVRESVLEGEPDQVEGSDDPRQEYERGWRHGYQMALESLAELIPVAAE